MPTQQTLLEIDQELQDQLKQLPSSVQAAITSADVKGHMRELSKTHQLHLDQWQLLEHEVMFAILGIEPAANLPRNIEKELRISSEEAGKLSAEISQIIFEPIRQELERQLEHPDAHAAAVTGTEAARTQELDAAHAEEGTVSTVQPATPPQLTPDIKITRPSDSTTYKPSEPSTARKNVVDDPYREPAN